MSRWGPLSERLAATDGGRLTLTWTELEQLVGALPPSAAAHRAWWSGDRPHVRAWREAGFTVANLAMGREVTFRRSANAASAVGPQAVQPPVAAREAASGQADVLLVACVKAKQSRPAAARDLYVSELFRRERAYAERLGVPWFILSAEHGLVAPQEWLAPYERYLPDTPSGYRRVWGAWVAERLEMLTGPLPGVGVEVHAGAAYVDAVTGPLIVKGATLRTPLAGLTLGQRLRWYGQQPGGPIDPVPPLPAEDGPEDAASVVAALLDRERAVAPADFLTSRGAGTRTPGLYSWWVDEVGAAHLSTGFQHPVAPGLIYAGLAGATRWPSGKRSTNTLWTRIADMHLGGRHEFSTFRRTLGSILAHAEGNEHIDEARLTDWMQSHLRVVVVPFADAASLGRLEKAVLEQIDPPLNLAGMSSTPARSRLSDLRSRHS